MGLFKKESHPITLTSAEKIFVKDVQKRTAEHSITLVKDDLNIFPLTTEKYKKITVVPITHHAPAFEDAKLLCEELRNRGFEVEYRDGIMKAPDVEETDLILYALFSRAFKPMGFLDFHSSEALKIFYSLQFGGEEQQWYLSVRHILVNSILREHMRMSMHAKRMYRAYKRSKAQLIINWPVAWMPTFRKVKELVDQGVARDVFRVQYRSPATYGPFGDTDEDPAELSKSWWYKSELGGESLSDYAGYGCLLTTWISGQTAKRVSGFKKNFRIPFSDVENYATLTIDFGNCVGLVEGSWSTLSNDQIPTGPVVYGSKAVIVGDRFDPVVKVYSEHVPYKL